MYSKNILSVNQNLLAILEIEAGKTCEFAFGTRRLEAFVKQAVDSENPGSNTIALNSTLAHNLGLPAALSLNIIRQAGTLRIGPLVGILAARYSSKKASFREQGEYFRHLLQRLRGLHGFGYVFTHQSIDWEKKAVRAHFLREAGRGWQTSTFPWPDAVYNRCLGGRGSTDSANALARMAAYGVRSFNTPLGSKWQVYDYLRQHPEIVPYLPETHILDSLQTLTKMLEKHGEVYVKTLDGHLGKNIIRISKMRKGYLLKKTGERSGEHYRLLEGMLGSSGWAKSFNRLLVQQSIKSPGKEGHFDVRVLVQKDRFNEWQITGIAARVAGGGMITSNLHTGGSAASLDNVLNRRGFNAGKVRNTIFDLKQVALKTAAALQGCTEALGDLGLDYVIDRDGKPWFLEANPRAGRRSFANFGRTTRRLAVLRPMEYASCLAGF